MVDLARTMQEILGSLPDQRDFDTREVADILGVAQGSVYRYVKRGILSRHRIHRAGRPSRYLRESVVEAIRKLYSTSPIEEDGVGKDHEAGEEGIAR